jgi:hypothetical protein
MREFFVVVRWPLGNGCKRVTAVSSRLPLPIGEDPSAADTGRLVVTVITTKTHPVRSETVPNKAAFFTLPSVQRKRYPTAGWTTQIASLCTSNVEDRIKEKEAAGNCQTYGHFQRHMFGKKQGKETCGKCSPKENPPQLDCSKVHREYLW